MSVSPANPDIIRFDGSVVRLNGEAHNSDEAFITSTSSFLPLCDIHYPSILEVRDALHGRRVTDHRNAAFTFHFFERFNIH